MSPTPLYRAGNIQQWEEKDWRDNIRSFKILQSKFHYRLPNTYSIIPLKVYAYFACPLVIVMLIFHKTSLLRQAFAKYEIDAISVALPQSNPGYLRSQDFIEVFMPLALHVTVKWTKRLPHFL